MNNRLVIDPLNLTNESSVLLSDFLSRHFCDGQLIRRDKTYWVGFQRICLSHDILIRRKTPGIWRYDVIANNNCGEGKFGSAHHIIATLKKSRDPAHVGELSVVEKQKRVYKIQKNAAINEYELMKRCPHLHVRGLFPGIPSLISMRKFNGQLLNDALNIERKQHPFTLSQRYKISISLLRALKKQIHDNMICHRDIKPDNIFYDPQTGEISIFDLGISQLIGDQSDRRSRGNATFTAPEDFISVRTGLPVSAGEFSALVGMESRATVKSDIYSIARVIGLVWRDRDPVFFLKEADHKKLMAWRITQGWGAKFQLFEHLQSLMPDEKRQIESQLQLMASINPDDRPELMACITYFDSIYLEHKLKKIPVALHAHMRESHQLALDAFSQLDVMEHIHDLRIRINVVVSELKIDTEISLSQFILFLSKKMSKKYKVLSLEMDQLCKSTHIHEAVLLVDFLRYATENTSVSSFVSLLRRIIADIPDDSRAVAEFIETLDVRCFAGMTSKQSLLDFIESMAETFTSRFSRLMQLYELNENNGNTLAVEELDYLLAELQKGRLNVDGIRQSSEHIERKLQKIENAAPVHLPSSTL